MGTALINRLFDSVAKDRLVALSISIGEMISIIVCRHNAGFISDEGFAQASAEFKLVASDTRLLRAAQAEGLTVRARRKPPGVLTAVVCASLCT
jgi:hypothetical protein